MALSWTKNYLHSFFIFTFRLVYIFFISLCKHFRKIYYPHSHIIKKSCSVTIILLLHVIMKDKLNLSSNSRSLKFLHTDDVHFLTASHFCYEREHEYVGYFLFSRKFGAREVCCASQLKVHIMTILQFFWNDCDVNVLTGTFKDCFGLSKHMVRKRSLVGITCATDQTSTIIQIETADKSKFLVEAVTGIFCSTPQNS